MQYNSFESEVGRYSAPANEEVHGEDCSTLRQEDMLPLHFRKHIYLQVTFPLTQQRYVSSRLSNPAQMTAYITETGE